MNRMFVARILALACLVCFAPTVFAQITFDPRLDQGRAQESDDCRKAVGATRTRRRCEPARTTVQQELRVSIEVPEAPSAQCEATSTTQYQQRNTIARVTTTVAVAGCTAASGELTVAARVRDESGEMKSLEFNEAWQRTDDQELELTADYPIGENVDLLSVRVRKLTCACADVPSEEVAE